MASGAQRGLRARCPPPRWTTPCGTSAPTRPAESRMPTRTRRGCSATSPWRSPRRRPWRSPWRSPSRASTSHARGRSRGRASTESGRAGTRTAGAGWPRKGAGCVWGRPLSRRSTGVARDRPEVGSGGRAEFTPEIALEGSDFDVVILSNKPIWGVRCRPRSRVRPDRRSTTLLFEPRALRAKLRPKIRRISVRSFRLAIPHPRKVPQRAPPTDPREDVHPDRDGPRRDGEARAGRVAGEQCLQARP